MRAAFLGLELQAVGGERELDGVVGHGYTCAMRTAFILAGGILGLIIDEGVAWAAAAAVVALPLGIALWLFGSR